MKRNLSRRTDRSAKRRRQDALKPSSEPDSGKETDEILSVREQAEPYRLATAWFPLDALALEWSSGRNRPIDEEHVDHLRRIFEEQQPQRAADSHRLRVACRAEEVERMVHHLRCHGQPSERTEKNGASLWPSFTAWEHVNPGRPAELMAGQHRVRALDLYLQAHPESSCRREWVCDLYDIGIPVLSGVDHPHRPHGPWLTTA